jgi:general secretion pathway protein E
MSSTPDSIIAGGTRTPTKLTPLPASVARASAGPQPRIDQDLFLSQLLESKAISEESAVRARTLLSQNGLPVVAGLLRLNAIAEAPLYAAYARHCQARLLSEQENADDRLTDLVRDGAGRLGLAVGWLRLKGVVLYQDEAGWHLAFRDMPSDEVLALVSNASRKLGAGFDWAVVPPSLYDRITRPAQQLVSAAEVNEDLKALRELAEEGPTIELVNAILSQAVTQRASDVHIEPEDTEFVVRVRVDGEMLLQSRQPRSRFDAVTCRVKILADLDIAEKRLPQDGRINARVNGESFDIRVSVLPGALGESTVLRLLRQERKPARLEDLGMSGPQALLYERWARLANGIVLVTGPTGSGKSTTLYTGLELANDRSKKIITVEDPVEYKIRGITQLQVNSDIGFTFAAALRSILRHDPDIIFVGEIRDEETARIAIQASLTGHMVLSTLHTNSAIGAVTRLIDMGIEPFLIAASVRGLMAQRLVRRLCGQCAVSDDAPDDATSEYLATWAAAHPGRTARPRKPVGCAHCAGTGYFGRFAIYDLVEIDRHLSHLITHRASESDLSNAVMKEGETGLLGSGIAHLADGQTTLAEILRATGEADH